MTDVTILATGLGFPEGPVVLAERDRAKSDLVAALLDQRLGNLLSHARAFKRQVLS